MTRCPGCQEFFEFDAVEQKCSKCGGHWPIPKAEDVGTVLATPPETHETDETLHHPPTTHHPHHNYQGELTRAELLAAKHGLTPRQARQLAWHQGRLRWKLDPNQKDIYDRIHSAPRRKFYLNCGRRVGKTYLLAIIAIETALKKANAVIKVAAPTAKAVRQFVLPIYRQIFNDCPDSLRPKFMAMDGEWIFRNGSRISIAGCDTLNNAEALRGPSCDLFEFDECGFINDLKYISSSIVAPMTLTTMGRVLYASSPAVSPAHESVTIYRELQMLGCAVTRTLYDNPRLTQEQINAFLEDECGLLTVDEFKQTVTFRREYLAEIIVDSTRAVIPEWDDSREKQLVREIPYIDGAVDTYVSLDVGFRDGMGVLYGFFDGKRLHIQSETLLFRQTTRQVADAIKLKEAKLWGNRKPYLRISDDDLLFLHDMSMEHGLTFIPTAKDQKELQVDTLRQWVQAGKITIDPSCKQLIHQLHTTVWNKSRNSFERNQDGHGDLVDSLVYLVRNIRRYRNKPVSIVEDPGVFKNPFEAEKSTPNNLMKLFTMKRGLA